jgi:hypothetical protein
LYIYITIHKCISVRNYICLRLLYFYYFILCWLNSRYLHTIPIALSQKPSEQNNIVESIAVPMTTNRQFHILGLEYTTFNYWTQVLKVSEQGRIQDFKLGGCAPKKIAPSGRRRENFWDISCEQSRFYAKKSYFFQLRREVRKYLRYFVWKITILRQKIIFFSNFRGGARRVRPPPLDSPLASEYISAISCREHVTFRWDDVRIALDQHA